MQLWSKIICFFTFTLLDWDVSVSKDRVVDEENYVITIQKDSSEKLIVISEINGGVG